ncbi:MAG: phosphoribosylformylglycinamidine cyclo-ligase, partial [Clostridia bacterium]|nr:phosphoribosylformylglycinamidine cyclo-ligase [Clostridia bacterium]
LDKHDTVGIDCVAMCVNDVLCCGARPLFFLDYLAVGKNVPERVAQIVGGVAEGCVQAGCALIGGETAEMPGFYPANEYDLAGFCVGMVDKANILDKNSMRSGDVLIALPSSGVHSNGFSLVRKALDVERAGLAKTYAELSAPLGETLLTPTKIYAGALSALLSAGIRLRAVAHITGGGLYENIPRSMGANMRARIAKKTIRTPPIFDVIARAGGIPERDMFNTFNMGVGMCLTVAKEDADRSLSLLRAAGEDAYALGEVEAGEGGIALC